MKKELEMKQAEEFSFLRKTETRQKSRIENIFQAFGYECSDGWYELLRSLCSEIVSAYEEVGQPVDIVIDQIKEKFGTLRFYYHFKGQKPGIETIDLLGMGSLRISKGDTPLCSKIAAIVTKWEDKSTTVCEKCGKPGKLRKDRPWIRTLCDDCNQSR